MSMSLDGFVAGPNQSEQDPIGAGGMQLHAWMFPLAAFRRMQGEEGGEVNASSPIIEGMFENVGATVMLTEGIESALEQAKEATAGKDVSLGGGADAVQQYLDAGLLDELQLSIVPVLLRDGERLFDNLGDAEVELEQVRAIEAPGVVHVTYRVR
jgi:hypothetical protein